MQTLELQLCLLRSSDQCRTELYVDSECVFFSILVFNLLANSTTALWLLDMVDDKDTVLLAQRR